MEKPNKKKKNKVLTPQSILDDLVYKTLLRKHSFLYGGVTKTNTKFCLGTLKDKDFHGGTFRFGISFLHLKDETIQKIFTDFIDLFFKGLNHSPVCMDLRLLGSCLNKVKWNLSRIEIIKNPETPFSVSIKSDVFDEVEIVQAYQFYYSPVKLNNIYTTFEEIVSDPLGKTNLAYPYKAEVKKTIQNIYIDHDNFIKYMINNMYLTEIRLPVILGLDLLVTTALETNEDTQFIGFLFWVYSNNAMKYCHCYLSQSFDIFTTRSSLILFQPPKE